MSVCLKVVTQEATLVDRQVGSGMVPTLVAPPPDNTTAAHTPVDLPVDNTEATMEAMKADTTEVATHSTGESTPETETTTAKVWRKLELMPMSARVRKNLTLRVAIN